MMKTNRQILFTGRTAGYWNWRVPCLVCTARGVVVLAVEARRDRRGGQVEKHGDYRDQDIVIRRSLDGGRTWLAPQKVLGHERFGPGPLHNFVMIAGRCGRLHALVQFDYRRLFCMTSDDDGETWSEPVEQPRVSQALSSKYPWKAMAVGPGHGIELRSGRLLTGIWLSDNSEGSHRPSVAATLFSDDEGASWHVGEIACPSAAGARNPNESNAVELPDGRVLMNLRNESPEHRRLICISPDGATRWSKPWAADDLLEPICHGASLGIRDPRDPSRFWLAFANPNTREQTLTAADGEKADRKNLTIKLSADEGGSWPRAVQIEPGPSGYSDMCIHEGKLLVAFECGMVGEMHDPATIAVETIALSELLAKQPRAPRL